MSFLSRLFGKSAPRPAAEPARPAPAPAPKPARPDPAVVAQAEEANVAQAITIGDLAEVGRWVLEGSSTRVRQMAARAITNPEQLHTLIPAVRGKDKNVYRILAAKRDELLAAQRAVQQRETAIAEAVAAVARHAERPWDSSYAGTLARLEARWNTVAAHASAEQQVEVSQQLARARENIDAQRRAAEAETERQRAAARAAEETRRQREHEAELAAAATEEQNQRLAAEREAERARHEEQDARVRELVGMLRQAQAALEHGGTGRATRLRDAIREHLPQAPALPVWFERKLQELDAKVEELKDWRTFTVVPKRAELVQRMQGLVGADMSPEELARQVRRLRDEWRTVHRGAVDEPTPEREQFEQAAERAYEPCREHFAQQAERRRENQARREALIERLAAFAAEQAGEQPDWRAVQRTLAEARREWREYAPVEQSVVADLQARFHAQLDALQARLEAEYTRNVQAKRDLVERAGALADVDDTREAIDGVKSLQRAWKDVGPVPRAQDEVLWTDFRRHCDAVFERSTRQAAAHDAARESNQARASALCDEVERLAGQDAESPQAARRQLETLRAEFEALELPRSSARDLRQRFERALGRWDAAARQRRLAADRRAWASTFAAAAHVRAYALAVARGLPPVERESLEVAAVAAVAALEHAPGEARARLEQQLARLTTGAVPQDPRANEAALRLLCVRAELLAGLETPAEDLELRREYQMRRLVESMGRGERSTPADLEGLALEWLAVGAVEPEVHDELFARFDRCLEVSAH